MDILIFGVILLIIGISFIFVFKNDYSYFGRLVFLPIGAYILTGLIFIISYIILNIC